MNNPMGTLKTRLESAMDAGIDGITLSAGLHLGTFALIEGHPRFRDVKLGIIVSSARALNLLLKKAERTRRLPDYVIVEGPLSLDAEEPRVLEEGRNIILSKEKANIIV